VSGLLLRYSPGEKVVRSVGDAPNGILAVSSHPAHFGFVVDGQNMPKGQGTICEVDPGGLPDHLTPVEVADVVDGVEADADLRFLWIALTESLASCAERAQDVPEYLGPLVGLAGAAREFLDEVAR